MGTTEKLQNHRHRRHRRPSDHPIDTRSESPTEIKSAPIDDPESPEQRPSSEECTQMRADRAGRIRLVGADRVRAGAWSSGTGPIDTQVAHQHGEHRRVPSLPGRNGDDQWQPTPVDELMDLRTQTTPRPADCVVSGLRAQVSVIR